MYSLCGNKRTNYYLKVRDVRVLLISCLPDSNRNSAGEYVRVSGNWFADELPYPLSPREVGLYRALTSFSFPPPTLFFCFTHDCLAYPGTNLLCSFVADSKRFNLDLRVVHVKDLNFVLRSKIFVNFDGQLRASHLILDCASVYKTWQPFSQALLVDSPLLSYIDVWHTNLLPPQLTVGEARDLGLQYTTIKDRALVRDASAELVS